MAKQVNPPRGMRDILPEEKARREWALSAIRGVYRAHGFEEIEAPIVENYDRLHAGLGGDNEKLSFSILRRGLEPDDVREVATAGKLEDLTDLGLRFDLTVPLARYYASNQAHLGPVFRAVQIGPVFRAERPQKGRYRQFVQADIDIIGDPTLRAEAELIVATSQALTTLGLRGLTVRVNDRRILAELLSEAGFAEADSGRVLISVDKLDKIGLDGVSAELREINPEATDRLVAVLERASAATQTELSHESITEVLGSAVRGPGVSSLVELSQTLEGLVPEGVTLTFDPTLVRGMGYYTGTIFEVAHPESGSSVGGGGRYDGMVGRFLERDVPAVGFSIGFERIIDLVREPALEEERVALISERDVPVNALLSLKNELVASGLSVVLEKHAKNMKNLLDRLGKSGVSRYAFVREDTRVIADLKFSQIEVAP